MVGRESDLYPALLASVLFLVGCQSKDERDASEMPTAVLDLPQKPTQRVEIPDGATVATMPVGTAGHVKWSFIHVDEHRKSWIDLNAPVFDLAHEKPAGEESDPNFYLFVKKLADGLYSTQIWLKPKPPFKWTPSPRPTDRKYAQLLLSEVSI
jgi:hypothetical protein